MTTSQYDATLTMLSPDSTTRRAFDDSRSGSPSAQRSVLVSRRWADLTAAPERFGFVIGQWPLPTLSHRELPAHGAECRPSTLVNRHELRHRAAMPFDHHALAVLDE